MTTIPTFTTAYATALILVVASMNSFAAAEATQPNDTDNLNTVSHPNDHIGPRILNPDPPVPAAGDRPLSDIGRWLTKRGVTMTMSGTYMYYGNPSTGLNTDKSESVGIFTAGFQLDLDKILGVRGGTLHFEQLFARVSNQNYGNEVGGLLAGKPGPFIPRVSHLTLFTYEQKLLDKKLSIEVGKSNAGNYFALPLCNVQPGCPNTILQDTAGFNPPPYANWSIRTSYDFSTALRAQGGIWRSDATYPFTDGWERRGNDVGGADALSTLYVANLAYRTNDQMESYPRSYEALVYHNNGMQSNPYYTSAGTSQLRDKNNPARTSKGTSGFYLGAKQTVWKANGGPASLAAWGNLTRTFNPDTTVGVSTMARTGLTLTGLWRSRPFDSYGISASWAQLTRSKQQQLVDSHFDASGQAYNVGRNEYSVGADAVFVLDRGLIVAAYANRIWNANSYLNPSSGLLPRDGWAVGLLAHMQIDDWLGLNSH